MLNAEEEVSKQAARDDRGKLSCRWGTIGKVDKGRLRASRRVIARPRPIRRRAPWLSFNEETCRPCLDVPRELCRRIYIFPWEQLVPAQKTKRIAFKKIVSRRLD